MAVKTITRLETHPVNTTGLNGIINGNWERLEAIFAAFTGATGDIQIGWSPNAFTVRAAQAAITYAATVTVSLAGAMTQTITLAGDLTIQTSNRLAGRRVTAIIKGDGSSRTLAFPAGWKWIGAAAPGTIAANKTGILELWSTDGNDTGVVARWTVEA